MLPAAVLAAGWVPFVIMIVLVLLFSGVYIKYYNNQRDSEASSTISAMIALSIALMTSALLPIDVFLVSFMKNSNGTFKDWAESNTTRASMESFIADGYYIMYGLTTGCIFLLLPFMYFYYEEKQENVSIKSRCCTALKYSIVCVILLTVLMLVGALVHTKQVPDHVSANSTKPDWDKFISIFVIDSNGIENSLSLVISILSLVGMLNVIFYTAYGMASWPLDLLRGPRSARKERMTIQGRRSDNRDRIAAIRNKYGAGERMSGRDIGRIDELEETEALMERQVRHLQVQDKGLCAYGMCCRVLRPCAILCGLILLLLDITIFLSLLLTNVDKILASDLGMKSGYILTKGKLPNVIDIILVFAQKVFPLDYILFVALVLYLFLSTMYGIRNIGIWFFCVKMYKIRARRTRPQGTLMMCTILMFALLGINILLYQITPQYSTFGSQNYVANDTTVQPCKLHNDDEETIKANCVMSRASMLLARFFYKMWIFGAAYYYATWLFLLALVVGFIVCVCMRARSTIDGEVEEDDILESDEELIEG